MNTNLSIEVISNNAVIETKALIGQADDLAKEHELFNSHYMVGGRKALYELLAKIFSLYESLRGAPDKKSLLSSMRHKLLHTHRIKTQSNSSDLGILVRYITRADRKTSHVYARAVEMAIASNISVEQFCEFVEKSGGIEQIRAIGVDKEALAENLERIKVSRELAWKFFRAREEIPFAEFDLKNDIDYGKNKKVNFEYFACIKRNNKRYVVAKIPADEIFEDRAIKLMGDYFCRDLDKAKEQVLKLADKSKEVYRAKLSKENQEALKILEAKNYT